MAENDVLCSADSIAAYVLTHVCEFLVVCFIGSIGLMLSLQTAFGIYVGVESQQTPFRHGKNNFF